MGNDVDSGSLDYFVRLEMMGSRQMLLIEVGLRMRKERRPTEYKRGNDPLSNFTPATAVNLAQVM
jgi:hypothetical protein